VQSYSGCVVFGRVSGDTAAAYVLQNAKAAHRLSAVAGHLIETNVKVDPSSSKVSIEFSWAGDGSSSSSSASGPGPAPSPVPASVKRTEPEGVSSSSKEAQGEAEAKESRKSGEYTIEEVSKHNAENDVWVVVEDQVCYLSGCEYCCINNFSIRLRLGPRCHKIPAGAPRWCQGHFTLRREGCDRRILDAGLLHYLVSDETAILTFLVQHDPKVIPRYAPDAVIGKLKK
jgi:hypothetical protein